MSSKQFRYLFSKMRIRICLWCVFAIFFLTVGVPLLFFYYLFDANHVKQMVISQFDNKNYTVTINGAVEPRSWHGLSLFIADLTINDKSGHKVMHINTANCQLSWLDLIVGHYRVERIAFNGLSLYQNNLNKINYVDLLNYQNLKQAEFKKLMNISITNLTMLNQDGVYLIKDANLSVLDLKNKPEFALNLRLESYNASLKVAGNFGQISNDNLAIESIVVKINAPKAQMELYSAGRYAYKAQELWLENIHGFATGANYHGALLIDTALLSIYGLTLNNILANFNNIDNQDLQKSMALTANRVKTVDFFNYKVNNILAKYEIKNKLKSLKANLVLQNSKLSTQLDLQNNGCKLEFEYVDLSNKAARTTGELTGVCSLSGRENLVQLQLQGEINQAATQLDFSYNYQNSKPEIKLSGSVASLDLSQFMSTTTSNLLPLYYDTTTLPFNWLNWFNLSANLKFQQLVLSHIKLNKVAANISVKDEQFKLNSIEANVYDGNLKGSMQLTKHNTGYDLSFYNQINNINLQKLFLSLFNVNAITGRANFTVNAGANGVVTYEDLHRKLTGKVDLTVANGGFSGIDFSLFLSPENLAAFQNASQVKTNFTNLQANFNFIKGVSKQSNISFDSANILAHGNGLIDFVNTAIDYNLNVSSILPKNVQNVKSVSIPVDITGDLFKPKIYIKNMTLNTVVPMKSTAKLSKHNSKR